VGIGLIVHLDYVYRMIQSGKVELLTQQFSLIEVLFIVSYPNAAGTGWENDHQAYKYEVPLASEKPCRLPGLR